MARPASARPTKKKLERQRGGSAKASVANLIPPGPSLRTGRRAGVGVAAQELKTYPPPPDTWPGTEPEWAIYWAHSRLGLSEGEDFSYRLIAQGSSLRHATGGVEVDFFEWDLNIAIDVQGFFAHYKLGAAKQALDQEQLVDLSAHGITVIFIDDVDAENDPVFFLREARNGVDHSLKGRGLV